MTLSEEIKKAIQDEIKAQEQARKLVKELKFRGVKAWNVPKLKTDPGKLQNSHGLPKFQSLQLKQPQ